MPDQVLNSVKNERTNRLISLSNRMADKFIEGFVGKTMPVLYEQEIAEGVYEGYTTNYIRVHSKSDKNLCNVIADTKIMSVEHETAEGRIV